MCFKLFHPSRENCRQISLHVRQNNIILFLVGSSVSIYLKILCKVTGNSISYQAKCSKTSEVEVRNLREVNVCRQKPRWPVWIRQRTWLFFICFLRLFGLCLLLRLLQWLPLGSPLHTWFSPWDRDILSSWMMWETKSQAHCSLVLDECPEVRQQEGKVGAASFQEGREWTWAEDGGREVPADRGVPGAELVQGWWHKDMAGFGEEPHLLAQTKLNSHDLGCFWRLVRAPQLQHLPRQPWKNASLWVENNISGK